MRSSFSMAPCCACAGACWLVVERPRAALLVLIFPIPYYLYLGSGHTVFVRYLVPMVPFVCLTAAFFVDRAALVVAERFSARGARDAAIVVLVSILGAQTLRASLLFDRLMRVEDARVVGADWIVSRFPSGASMFQSGFGAGHVQPTPRGLYPQYTFNERADRFELDRRAAPGLPDLVVLLDADVLLDRFAIESADPGYGDPVAIRVRHSRVEQCAERLLRRGLQPERQDL